MLIFIRNQCGETLTVDVAMSDTVFALKERIFQQHSLPVEQQAIICAGKLLDDALTLSEFDAQKLNCLHLVTCQPSSYFHVHLPFGVVCCGTTPNFHLASSVVKDVLQQETKISPEDQILYVCANELDAESSLRANSVPASSSSLLLIPFPKQHDFGNIIIETDSFHHFCTFIDLTLGVSEAIQLIGAQTGWPCHGAQLQFDGKFIGSNSRLIDNGIACHSIVKWHDADSNASSQTAAASPQKPEQQSLTLCVIAGGNAFTVTAPHDATVAAFKQQLESEVHVIAQQQQLYFAGFPLEDDKRLSSYCLQPHSTIVFAQAECKHTNPNLQLFVQTLTGGTFSIHVCEDWTVHELKLAIAREHGIAPAEQRLISSGKEMQDCSTLREYHLQKCTTLHLVVSRLHSAAHATPATSSSDADVQVHIQSAVSGRMCTVFANANDSVQDICDRAVELTSSSKGAKYVLYTRGYCVSDELQVNAITGKARLCLATHATPQTAIQLTVIATNKTAHQLKVLPSFTIGQLKRLMAAALGVSALQLQLVSRNVVLMDRRTVEESELKAGDKLYLLQRGEQNVYIRDFTDRQFVVAWAAAKPVSEIKEELAEESRVPAEHQVLFFSGGALQNRLTLEECGVPPNSVILLAIDANVERSVAEHASP